MRFLVSVSVEQIMRIFTLVGINSLLKLLKYVNRSGGVLIDKNLHDKYGNICR